MVQTFICNADGELLNNSNETKNIRWVPLIELKELLEGDNSLFYPMHITTLGRYLKTKLRY
jgi:ADP-ribose pyrophosphatase